MSPVNPDNTILYFLQSLNLSYQPSKYDRLIEAFRSENIDAFVEAINDKNLSNIPRDILGQIIEESGEKGRLEELKILMDLNRIDVYREKKCRDQNDQILYEIDENIRYCYRIPKDERRYYRHCLTKAAINGHKSVVEFLVKCAILPQDDLIHVELAVDKIGKRDMVRYMETLRKGYSTV